MPETKRRTVRVTFNDGSTITTEINGTEASITRYYVGNAFNFGDTPTHPKDKMLTGVSVEFLK